MPDLAELAVAMRAALRRARCDSTVPVEVAAGNLELAVDEIERLCEDEVLEVLVLTDDVLLQAYAFAAEAAKVVKPDHPARPPEYQHADPAVHREFLRTGTLPHLDERRRQALAALDERYPSS